MGTDASVIFDIVQSPLASGQFVDECTEKRQIFLHHTASGPDPYAVLRWWGSSRDRIATSYVIGGRPSRGGRWRDGQILQAFDSTKWAWHLGVTKAHLAVGGTRAKSSKHLNSHSIGIEICNWGPLTKRNGRFVNYLGHRMHDDEVIELPEAFRGFRYYHGYTKAQIESVARLLRHLGERWNIPLDYKGDRMFAPCPEALQGEAGVWTHTSVREDKFDCFPQPELLTMLRSLVTPARDERRFAPVDLQGMFAKVQRLTSARESVRAAIADMVRYGDEGAMAAGVATAMGAVLMTTDILREGLSALDARAAKAFEGIEKLKEKFGEIEEAVSGTKRLFPSRADILATVDERFVGIRDGAALVSDAKQLLAKAGITHRQLSPLVDLAVVMAEDTALIMSAAQSQNDVREQTRLAVDRAVASLRGIEARLRITQEKLMETVRLAEMRERVA